MLVVMLSPWTYSGRLYPERSLVQMPSELFAHIKEVSIAAQTFKQLDDIYNTLTSGQQLSSELQNALSFEETEEGWTFYIDTKRYFISKNTNERMVQ